MECPAESELKGPTVFKPTALARNRRNHMKKYENKTHEVVKSNGSETTMSSLIRAVRYN